VSYVEDHNETVFIRYGKGVCVLEEVLLQGYNVDIALYECNVGSTVKYGRYEHTPAFHVRFFIC
jgi:hypothetical protein